MGISHYGVRKNPYPPVPPTWNQQGRPFKICWEAFLTQDSGETFNATLVASQPVTSPEIADLMTISQQGTVGVVGWLAIKTPSSPRLPSKKLHDERQAKDSYKSDLEFMRRFSLQSGMELVVGEYTLAGQEFFFWGFHGGWCLLVFFFSMKSWTDGFSERWV